MSRTWKVALILALALSALSLAGLGNASAPHTFTVRGQVTYPDGRPAAGLELKIFAMVPQDSSGQGVDQRNVIYKIPNYDTHQVWTDADGRYVMTNVIDYPENPTHFYTVRVMESSHVWHGGVKFKLWTGKPEVPGDFQLEEAAWVTIKLKDKDGKPYNGNRVIYFQVGTDLSTPTKGYQRFSEVNFVNGEAGIRVVIRDKNSPVTRVAIVDAPSMAEAVKAMEIKGLKKNLKGAHDGFELAHKDAKGRVMDRKLDLVPLSETTVEFNL